MKTILYAITFFVLLTGIANSQSISPIIEETINIGNGNYYSLIGYNNTSGSIQNIPIGSSPNNRFNPTPQDRGQPTTFQTGRQYGVFTVNITYGSNVTWLLTNRTATTGTRNVWLTVDDGSTLMPPVGQNVTYTIKYYNYENSTYQNVRIRDTIPAGLTFVSATNGGTLSGNAVVWTLPNLAGQDSGQVQVTFQVTSTQTEYNNKVYLRGTMGNTVGANNNDVNSPSGSSTVTYRDSSLIAFEDLKNSGWNDWDVNDFVASWKSAIEVNNNGGIVKITYDYEALARGSSFDHTLFHKLNLSGNTSSTLTVRDSLGNVVNAWSYSNQQNTGEFTANIFQSTIQALPAPIMGNPFANTQHFQVGIIKGYTAKLEVTVDPAQNTYNSFINTLSNSDPYIVTILNQSIHIASIAGAPGNTQNVDNNVDSTTVLYGYFLDLAYKLPYNWKWPLEGPTSAIWKSYPQFESYILSNKNSFTTWYNNPDTSKTWNRRVVTGDNRIFAGSAGEIDTKLPYRFNPNADIIFTDSADSYFSSPKPVDLNNDGNPEVIIGNLDKKLYVYQSNGMQLPGFPVVTGGFIRSTPVIDKNNDNTFVIAFGCEDGKLYAVNQAGQNLPGFPIAISNRPIKSSPVIADLNNDGNKEIVIFSGDGQIYIYSKTGQLQNGFPVRVQNTQDQFGNIIIMPTPAVMDITYDGFKDIIVGTIDSSVKVIDRNGNVLSSTNVNGAIYSTPQVIKQGSDFRIIAATSSGSIYNINWNGNVIASRKFNGESFISSPVIIDIYNDGSPEIITGSMQGKIRLLNLDANLTSKWTVNVVQEIISSPIVADIDGDNNLDILYGLMNGFLIPLSRDGFLLDDTTMQSALVPFNSWIVSTSAIADIDNNGKLDVVTASFDRTIKTFELPQTNPSSKIAWGMFGGNMNNTNVSPVSVKKIENSVTPMQYELNQNYPNPFNPTTKIHYKIPENTKVKLTVYNLLGQEVKILVNNLQQAGNYEVDLNFNGMSSGLYFYTLETDNFKDTKKMMLVK